MITKAFALMAAAGLALMGACASSNAPDDDPTTRSLKDPMNYSANPQQDDLNINGGSYTTLNSKALNKDLQNAANP